MSNTLEVGKKLVALCRQGKNLEAVEQLYAPNVVSIEAMSMPEMPAPTMMPIPLASSSQNPSHVPSPAEETGELAPDGSDSRRLCSAILPAWKSET